MNWIKKGLIFDVENRNDWMNSFATVPFAENIENDLYRIYFSTRDKQNHSSTAFIEIDINDPKKILTISEKPVLNPGELGTFDDSGAMGSCLVNHQDTQFLYYIGWNEGITVPYRNSIGLAIKQKHESIFKKYSKGPIVDRTSKEPHFVASNFVLVEDDLWKMWYLSCNKWEMYNGKPRPMYNIKYAESNNGIDWLRKNQIAIGFKDKHEWAISRPCIIKEDIYKMWYSYSGKEPYRIGYAESNDGKTWERKDDSVGITVSESGWDSLTVEYPFVFEHKGTKYMLYCGNDFGKTGFGYAILE